MSLWRADSQAVQKMTIEQIVATAGDGRLRDKCECQDELREYLRQVSIDELAKYANHCLTSSFNKSGQVLQDIINELGRRLEYRVSNGLYQGTKSEVGFDGLWKNLSGHGMVVEVKTSDAFRLSLDTVIKYRDDLITVGTLQQPCSILIVVGRTDTGELEAQVRGSRHSWHIRLISVDGLFNLVRVKESADSQQTIAKIQKVLTPIEYTRLDDLVDVMFTTAQNVESALASETRELDESETETTKAKGTWELTPSEALQEKREIIIDSVGKLVDTHYVKKSRAMYWDPDHTRRLVCTICKRYTAQGAVRYWYAYHPSWDEFLGQGDEGHVALGCMDLDIAFSLPLSIIRQHLNEFHITEKKDGTGKYWHKKIIETDTGEHALQLPHSEIDLPLEKYVILLKGNA
jgi:hypothetical protein